MRVQIKEHTIQLRDMVPGDVAVSPDRKDVYACANFITKEMNGKPVHAIFKLNSLTCQYMDNWDYGKHVVKLGAGHSLSLDI